MGSRPPLTCCYAMSSTELACGAMPCLCDARYSHSVRCYQEQARCGTEPAYGATRSGRMLRSSSGAGRRYDMLWSYALATECPVLS
eukprot:2087453-Rhodomonas_salina.4